MGIRSKGGKRPFSKSQFPVIDRVLADARRRYAEIAAKEGVEIFQSYVPIDTQELKSSIRGSVRGDFAVIEVPSVNLNHKGKPRINAKKLALILEIGIGKSGSILHRTKSNTAPSTAAGQPTEDWLRNAVIATRNRMAPIGQSILQSAIRQAMKALING